MSVGHRCLVTSIEAVESFSFRDVFISQGIDILRLQTWPTLLHFHGMVVRVGCVIEPQDPFH